MIIPVPGFSEPVASWTHILAAALSVVGGALLLKRGRGNFWRMTALSTYTLSMIFLFSMSGVYHLLEPGGTARSVLQRLDHAGIWVLIAGTFTPIHAILFRGPWRWLVLSLVWTLAITGLTLEVVFFDDFPEWLLFTLFLGLGWMGALTGLRFRAMFNDSSFSLLVLGGVFYSLGALADISHWPVLIDGFVASHEVFHFFVMLGAYCHWKFIYQWADHPVSNTIVFHVLEFPDQRHVATAEGERFRFEGSSREELRIKIQTGVGKRFHHTIQPHLQLRFFAAEQLG